MGEEPIRVVLDTNVLISALLWQKALKDIFILVRNGRIKICISQDILKEFQRVLTYSKMADRLRLINKSPQELIDEFLEIVNFFPAKKLSTIIIKADPSDDAILACAVASNADLIISGDRHLKRLKFFSGIPILSPAEFLKLFS